MAKNIPMGEKIHHFAHCPYQEIHNYLNMNRFQITWVESWEQKLGRMGRKGERYGSEIHKQ